MLVAHEEHPERMAEEELGWSIGGAFKALVSPAKDVAKQTGAFTIGTITSKVASKLGGGGSAPAATGGGIPQGALIAAGVVGLVLMISMFKKKGAK